jgi:hypothetical protein
MNKLLTCILEQWFYPTQAVPVLVVNLGMVVPVPVLARGLLGVPAR